MKSPESGINKASTARESRAKKLESGPVIRTGMMRVPGSEKVPVTAVGMPEYIDSADKLMVRIQDEDAEVYVPFDSIEFDEITPLTDEEVGVTEELVESDIETTTPKERTQKQRNLLGNLVDKYKQVIGGKKPEHDPADQEKLAKEEADRKEAAEVAKLTQEETFAKELRLNAKRVRLQEAREERREILKDYLAKEATFKKIKKPSEEQKLEFADVKKGYLAADERHTKAQLEYAKGLDAALRKRLTEQEKSPEEVERITRRYNRMIRFREVVAPAIQQENEVRLEVAGEKSKNIFQKVWGGLQTINQKAEDTLKGQFMRMNMSEANAGRVARTTVRAMRLVSFATLGAAAGTGVAVGGLAVGAAGIGAGAVTGWIYGKHFELTKGKARAQAYEDALGSEITNAEDLATQREAIASGSREAIERARATRESIVSALTGFTVSMSSLVDEHALESVRAAMEHIKETAVRIREEISDFTSAPETEVASGDAPAALGEGVTVAPFAPPTEATEAPVPETSADLTDAAEVSPAIAGEHSLSVEGRINNADRLIGHFGLQLQGEFPDAAEAPASVQKLFELLTTEEGTSLLAGEDRATVALGFQGENGLSAIMQPGDTVSLNEAGEIVFERPGEPELTQVLINAEGEVQNASERVLGETGFVMQVPNEETVATPAVPVETPPVHEAPEVPVATESSIPEGAQAPEPLATQPSVEVPYSSSPPPPDAYMDGSQLGAIPQQPEAAVSVNPSVEGAPSEAPGVGVSLRDFNEQLIAAEVAAASAEAVTDVFTNQHGVEVNPNEPSVYSWRIPGTTLERLVAYGQDAVGAARRYVEAHPRAMVMFEAIDIDPITGAETSHMEAWSMDQNGQPVRTPQVIGEAGRPYPIPSPEDFTRELTP